jgi:hypothetical protein
MDQPWIFEVAWGNPYTSPPDGQPRVLLRVKRMGTAHPVPAEIDELLARIGYGNGYTCTVGLDMEYAEAERRKRMLTPEQKERRRRTLLVNEARKRAPLYADQIIDGSLPVGRSRQVPFRRSVTPIPSTA